MTVVNHLERARVRAIFIWWKRAHNQISLRVKKKTKKKRMVDKTPEATNATVQAEEPGQATEQGQLEQPQLHNTRTTGRRRWTTEENRDVMICFYRANAQGRFFGKTNVRIMEYKIPKH